MHLCRTGEDRPAAIPLRGTAIAKSRLSHAVMTHLHIEVAMHLQRSSDVNERLSRTRWKTDGSYVKPYSHCLCNENRISQILSEKEMGSRIHH